MLVKSEQKDTVLGGSDSINVNVVLLCGQRVDLHSDVLNCHNKKIFYQLNLFQNGDYLEDITEKDIKVLGDVIDECIGFSWDQPIVLVALIKDGSSLTSKDYKIKALMESALRNAKRNYVLYYCVTNNEAYKKLNIKLL
ncbi:MAG: hypothetical protein HY973_02180 [Candidatus Kerfeldbacteria bacterium]|nr:hypothetical protein [Candidatus Kerfeldbacteria bacterium]